MTPKEKAEELVDKFMKYRPIKMSDYTNIEYPSAVNLAKICVYEILHIDTINCNQSMDNTSGHYFWQQVEQELNEM